MNNIFLLKLKCGPTHLPKSNRNGTLAVSTGVKAITDYWFDASPELKDEVFKERTKDYNIESVAFIIAVLPDVTIFSTTKTENNDTYSNPFIIANKNIAEHIDLTEVHTVTDIVVVKWEDATYNFNEADIETIKLIPGTVISTTVGFLADINNERAMICGRHNLENNTYRDRHGIPLGMINAKKGIHYLKAIDGR